MEARTGRWAAADLVEAAVEQIEQADGGRLEEGEHLDDEAAARLQGFQRAEHFTEVQVRDDTLLFRRLTLLRSQVRSEVTEHFTKVQVRDDTLLLRRLTLSRSQIRSQRTQVTGQGLQARDQMSDRREDKGREDKSGHQPFVKHQANNACA